MNRDLMLDARFAYSMLAAICESEADCTADRMKARDAAYRVLAAIEESLADKAESA